MGEALYRRAEDQSRGQEEDPWNNDATGTEAVNQYPHERGHDRVGDEGHGLGTRSTTSAPGKVFQQSYIEDRKGTPHPKPKSQGDNADSYDEPTIIETLKGGFFLHQGHFSSILPSGKLGFQYSPHSLKG